MSLAGTPAGLDSSRLGSATLGFVRNPGPREGGGDARRLCGLDLLRDVAEGVGL